MAHDLDFDLSILLIILFAFFATNFSPQMLGIIYLFFVIAYLIARESPNVPDFNFAKTTKNLPKLILIVGIGIMAWLFLSQIGIKLFGTVTTNLNSVVNLLASETTAPYITTNPYLYEFVFGIVIPLAETLFFFGFVMPWLMKKLKFTYSDRTKWIIAIIAIGLICSIFHYTAHIFSNEALIADFIFFALSGVVVLYYQDLSAASLLHIISNSIILLSQIGVIH